ncbi:glycosyltransferase family protein [Lichenibacterium dinghuense]|uniref:glycosyltransferase family protein n=1 Tax=Lichenibacterium dinghuense TaxID=2895977 RepID=UPI001F219B57|nr:methyltransferase domain-containing protein [Lichenibacterium sp. 6Y81]
MNAFDPIRMLPVSCLNLGSGKDFQHDCFNVDVDDTWAPDAVLDFSAVDLVEGGVTVHTRRFGLVTLGPGSFDRIIANDVLEHVPDLKAMMTTCLGLLRMNGRFAISVPYDLSLGAWQDPTHVRAFNERSWLYYTDWFWYMGWSEFRFVVDDLRFVPSPLGEALAAQGVARDAVLATPRAVDSMSVTLRKVALTTEDRAVWEHWRERRRQAQSRNAAVPTPAAPALAGLDGSWSAHADRHCIYVVTPKGYDHHRAFDEAALGLSAAFAERGGSAPVVHHPSEWAGRLPIVLGAHLLSPAMSLALPEGSVIYNLEQIDRASGWLSDAYLAIMRRHRVLDYSHRNIAALRAMGIAHARLLPLGHADALERIARGPAEDIDVLFYGSLNERRAAVLEDLRARGVKVVHLFNVYGSERDAAIARSKIVLNMHHYEAAIFESARVGYLLANGACVVTEGVEGDPDLASYQGGLAICGYGELADLCMLLLGEDAVRTALGERGRALMRANRQADRLGELFTPEQAAA